jgi:large repetitive protein
MLMLSSRYAMTTRASARAITRTVTRTMALAGILTVAFVGPAVADATPATPTITAGPSGTATVRTPTFTYSSATNVTFKCSLDSTAASSYTPCPSAAGKTGAISYSALGDGSHTFRVLAQAGTAGSVVSAPAVRTWSIDATRPTVVAITRLDPSPRALGTARWQVTFSEPVVNVGLGNFSLAATGLGGSPALLSITPNAGPATVYTVSATSGSGTSSVNPTLRLDLSNTGAIRDAAGNTLNGTTTGATYVFDGDVPIVTLTKLNGSVTTFPRTMNATVTGISGACGTSPGDVGTVLVVISGPSSALVTVPCSAGAWTLATTLSTAGVYNLLASQIDGVRNVGTSGTKTITIDKTAPMVAITKVNGATASFPFTSTANVTSLGGTCGVATGDAATVTVLISGSLNRTDVVPCTAGAWSDPVALAAGTYSVTAMQTDTAGNTGTSGAKTITVSTLVPAFVSLTMINGSTIVNGSSTIFPLTTNVQVSSIGGSCAMLPGSAATVSVSIIGPTTRAGTAPCLSGTWTFALSPVLRNAPVGIDDGNYTITATQGSASNAASTGPRVLTLATRTFTVSGNAVTQLRPGGISDLNLTVTNPYGFALKIESLTVTFTGTASCNGPANFAVARPFSGPTIVPAGSSVLSPAVAPQIRMLNLPTAQDSCKSMSVSLTYSGMASRA